MPVEPVLPSLPELGTELLLTTPWQRRLALARPLVGVAAFVVAAWWSWWWLTPLIVFLIFIAVVTVTHDVVHGSLGLSRRQTDWALFACGAILFESGHAYRQTHLRHHAVFPGPGRSRGRTGTDDALASHRLRPVLSAATMALGIPPHLQ